MELIIIMIASLLASLLTLFSGFGLGTLLMPFFALFFSVDVAITLTAVVHLLNNLFKLLLVGKFADREIAIKFGFGAVVSSFLGAVLLGAISTIEPIFEYPFFNRTASITPLKLLIALLLMVFVWLESRASEKRLKFERSDLWLGGLLSGFFGGLSGQQGALRSIFLLKYDLTKETYIATSIVIACLIDVARLPVYLNRFNPAIAEENTTLLVCACLSAFVGAFIGARLMRKVTMQAVQRTVAAMLVLIACLMASGII